MSSASDILERVYTAQVAKGFERGRVEGEQQAIMHVLRLRFHSVPEALEPRVAAVTDAPRLAALLEWAVTAPSLAEFEGKLE